MTTLITGATGFVGSAVARVLAARGHRLRLMARPGADLSNTVGLDAERVDGDLTRPETFDAALSGCRYLFHVAADYRLWVPDPGRMMTANVTGTRLLMLAAQRAGVEKIVYCSSVAALGLIGDGSVADEETPVDPAKIVGVYKQSKYRAEQEVLRLVRETALPAVIVNPSTPVGPRDIKPTPTGRMIADAASGKMPAFVDTGLNIVHVDDVAEGHALALERGTVGRKYILGGEDMSLRELFALVSGIAQRTPPRLSLDQRVLWPLAIGAETAARLFGIDPVVTREMLSMSKKKMYFSSARARAELGYVPRPARLAIEDAVGWFRAHGLVP